MKILLALFLASSAHAGTELRQQSFSPSNTNPSVNNLNVQGSMTAIGSSTIAGLLEVQSTANFSGVITATSSGTFISTLAANGILVSSNAISGQYKSIYFTGSGGETWELRAGPSTDGNLGVFSIRNNSGTPLLQFDRRGFISLGNIAPSSNYGLITSGAIEISDSLKIDNKAHVSDSFTSIGSMTVQAASIFNGNAAFWGASGGNGKVLIASVTAASAWDTTTIEITGKGGTTWGLLGESGGGALAGGFSLENQNAGVAALSVLPDDTYGGKFGFNTAPTNNYQIILGNIVGLPVSVSPVLVAQSAMNVSGPLTVIGSSLTILGNSNLAGATSIGSNGTLFISASSASIKGVTNGSNAEVGLVGEFISDVGEGNNNPGGSGTYINVATITLTAGDWDISGACNLTLGGTTAMVEARAGISTNPGSIDASSLGALTSWGVAALVNQRLQTPVGPRRVTISGSTTYNLVCYLAYTTLGGAVWTGSDSHIQARRMR